MSRQRRPNHTTTPTRRRLHQPLRLLRLEDRIAPAMLIGLNGAGNALFPFNSATPGPAAAG